MGSKSKELYGSSNSQNEAEAEAVCLSPRIPEGNQRSDCITLDAIVDSDQGNVHEEAGRTSSFNTDSQIMDETQHFYDFNAAPNTVGNWMTQPSAKP
ncbi:unnamed protein product, partial [Allacma fusca]